MKPRDRPSGRSVSLGVLLALPLLAELALALTPERAWAWASGSQGSLWTLRVAAVLWPVALSALAAWALKQARELKRGAPGRARLLLGSVAYLTHAASLAAAAILIAASDPDRLPEIGPLAWSSPERWWVWGAATLAAVSGSAALGSSLACWFLIRRAARRRIWLVLDLALLGATVLALLSLPSKVPPNEPEALALALVRHLVTTLAVVRLALRAVPFCLDLVERISFQSLVAARHLRAKKSGFLAAISLLSVLAVSVSSCALTTTLSVMGGFRNDLKRKILGHHAHVVVDVEHGTFEGWQPLLQRMRTLPDVAGASPYVSGEVMLSSASNLATAVLRGIDPARIGEVSDLTDDLTAGKLSYLTNPERLLDLPPDEYRGGSLALRLRELRRQGRRSQGEPDAAPESATQPPSEPGSAASESQDGRNSPQPVAMAAPERPQESPASEARNGPAENEKGTKAGSALERATANASPGILVGQELARSLRLYVGDEVNVVAPLGSLGPSGPMPKSRPFRVAAIFYTGMYEYDMKYTYVMLPVAQRFLATGGAISGVEVKARNVDRAPETAERIRRAIARPSLRVRDWQELNKRLFGALALEKLAMFVALGIAILVASFCIAGTLTLMVQEKGREVAILKALGTSRRSTLGVFLIEGALIGLFGAAIGMFLGYMVCFGAENLGIRMNPEVYYIDRLPIHTDAMEFAAVGVASVAVCLLVTIYPALLASRLRP
ncbi:MAG: FtsX-like permease family protein, partial [Proteobacteria bacterium]|nr:FtsX-like permease family protein [Pseudomonadota bacterium]